MCVVGTKSDTVHGRCATVRLRGGSGGVGVLGRSGARMEGTEP